MKCQRSVVMLKTVSPIGLFNRSIGIRCQTTVAAFARSDKTSANDVKPFHDIPGPKPLPLIGNAHRYFPVIGEYNVLQFDKAQVSKYEKYGKIVLERGLSNNENVVNIFDPDDYETLARNEGALPVRPLFRAMEFCRQGQPEKFPNMGLFMSQGKDWYDVRSQSQQVMLRKKVIEEVAETADVVAKDFLKRIEQRRTPEGRLPDLQTIGNLWGLESISYILLGKRLGLLEEEISPESKLLMENLSKFWQYGQKLEFALPLYKVFPKLSITYQRFKKSHDGFYDIVIRLIKEAKLKAQNESLEEDTVMHMILKKMSPELATVIAIDIMFAGVDTTSTVIVKLLRCLADNPECQEKVRAEAKAVIPEGKLITAEMLDKMPYIKVALKESQRLYPVVHGVFRRLTSPLTLGGYHVPEGTVVIANNFHTSLQEKYFPEPNRYVPERWMKGTEENKKLGPRHVYAMTPFGVGPRMCIGKRIAEMEVYAGLVRILEKYDVSYESKEPLEVITNLIWMPKSPLKFVFKERAAK